MMRQKLAWIRLTLKWRGSVAPTVLPGVLLCGGFGLLVSAVNEFGILISWQSFAQGLNIFIANVAFNFVLGLLLVFRTNTAYERFWEGRKAWTTIIANTRNLGYLLRVSVGETEPDDRSNKLATMRLLIALAIATRLHLQQQSVGNELDNLISSEQLLQVKAAGLAPLQIATWVGEYLQQQYDRKLVNANQLTEMNGLVNGLLDSLAVCERIVETPIPLAYSIYLKRLLVIYCFCFPFQVVEHLEWWTGAIAAILSFVLFGIEAIGEEIENPFGNDANDLPLEEFCTTIQSNIEDLICLNSQETQEVVPELGQ